MLLYSIFENLTSAKRKFKLFRRYRIVVVRDLPKVVAGVRFPLPAPKDYVRPSPPKTGITGIMADPPECFSFRRAKV